MNHVLLKRNGLEFRVLVNENVKQKQTNKNNNNKNSLNFKTG